MFVHKEGLDYKELKTKNIDGKRHYVTPNGNYPSVTTVTSLAIKDGIKAWRERVGEKEANKIASQAARRGTKVHKICEDYLNNIDLNYEEIEPIKSTIQISSSKGCSTAETGMSKFSRYTWQSKSKSSGDSQLMLIRSGHVKPGRGSLSSLKQPLSAVLQSKNIVTIALFLTINPQVRTYL